MGETQTNLTFSAYAYVTSDLYDITGVYLLDGDDTYICQLSGPASGGNFTFSVNPATFLPNGTERILVVNEGGYDAVEPVDNFYTPNEVYRSGWLMAYTFDPGWYYWDVDADQFYSLRNENTDIRIQKVAPNYQRLYLQDPTNVKWKKLLDFPDPSKSFIKSITLGSSPGEFRFSDSGAGDRLWYDDSLAFITEQGRYGYIKVLDAGGGGYWSLFYVYSLYEGLGQ